MAEIEKEQNQVVKDVIDQKYEYGFTTDVHTEIIEKGLNEDVVRLISQKKGEPDWMHKYKGKYYFSYSTGDTHYLCYAVGDNPYGPFT